MKSGKFVLNYREYETVCELPEHYQKLVKEATEATFLSYTPYSNFNVGVALMLDNEEIIKGSNQENAAYPSGLCAERVALFYANSSFPNQAVKAIAVAARNKDGFLPEPIAPCGACRQVMLETETRFAKDMEIILYGEKSIYVIPNAKMLLPYFFDKESL